MSRSILRLAFVVVAAVPFVLACDMFKKDEPADASVLAPPVTAATTAAPVDPGTPTAIPISAPLGAAATPTPAGAVKPAAVDAGKAADGGVVVVDAGADSGPAAPVPTPTFALPTAIPGFDAAAFTPPAGFPSAFPTALPTFPPPAK